MWTWQQLLSYLNWLHRHWHLCPEIFPTDTIWAEPFADTDMEIRPCGQSSEKVSRTMSAYEVIHTKEFTLQWSSANRTKKNYIFKNMRPLPISSLRRYEIEYFASLVPGVMPYKMIVSFLNFFFFRLKIIFWKKSRGVSILKKWETGGQEMSLKWILLQQARCQIQLLTYPLDLEEIIQKKEALNHSLICPWDLEELLERTYLIMLQRYHTGLGGLHLLKVPVNCF